MTKFFFDFVRDEKGAAAAEYALILAIVGSAIAASAIALGNTIAGAMNAASAKICANDLGCTG
jgi:pilus assembly protein Flp/PilA